MKHIDNAKGARRKLISRKPDELLLHLERLITLLRSAEFEGGLNPAQWEALRYISMCNALSDSPKALTEYLGATKGTVSQTLNALERKGLISKSPREGEGRSIRLALTAEGEQKLEQDPHNRIASLMAEFKPKFRARLEQNLDRMVRAEALHSNTRSFGICQTCRFFREKGADKKKDGPHQCLLFNIPLSKKASRRICVEHEPS